MYRSDVTGLGKTKIEERSMDLVKHFLSPISDLFSMPGVTDVFVNRYDEVFIKKNGANVKTDLKFANERMVQAALEQIAKTLKQTCDKNYPILDARLPGGIRVCGTQKSVSTKGAALTFRLSKETRLKVEDIIQYGSLTEEMADYLRCATVTQENIIVSGATGSGKTTLLMALTDYFGSERVVSAEDTHELKIDVENYKSLEAPVRDNDEKHQEINMAVLIKACLRETPKRIIVGEVRDPSAAAACYEAISTGHSVWTTMHANSVNGALRRFERLVTSFLPIPYEVIREDVRENVCVFVHSGEVCPNNKKKVLQIAEIINGEMKMLWEYDMKKKKHESFKEHIKSSKVIDKFNIINNV